MHWNINYLQCYEIKLTQDHFNSQTNWLFADFYASNVSNQFTITDTFSGVVEDVS